MIIFPNTIINEIR